MTELAYRKSYDLRNSLPCNYGDCPFPRVAGRSRCESHLDLCGLIGCPNKRIVKQGAQYCVEHSERRFRPRSERIMRRCELCGGQFERTYQPREGMLLLCKPCGDRWSGFALQCKRHGVPRETALEWMASPVCYWCDESISFSYSKITYNIDHNHSCCPGKYGCVKCFRGIAHPNCNRVIGQIETAARAMGNTRFSLKVYRLLADPE